MMTGEGWGGFLNSRPCLRVAMKPAEATDMEAVRGS
jgi:hypothetical protein